jgi:hypothetical protein
MNNNLYNKRRRRSYVDCDDFYNLNESSEMIDVLTSRRMRILLHEKPWHSHIDPHTAVSKVNAATLSVKDQRELQEFQDEQRNIQLQMADEALNQWKVDYFKLCMLVNFAAVAILVLIFTLLHSCKNGLLSFFWRSSLSSLFQYNIDVVLLAFRSA